MKMSVKSLFSTSVPTNQMVKNSDKMITYLKNNASFYRLDGGPWGVMALLNSRES